MSIIRRLGERLLAVLAPVALAVWGLGLIDGLAILARGGAAVTLLPVHGLLVSVGVVAGGLAWLGVEGLTGLGRLLAAGAARLGRFGRLAALPRWVPAPSRWVALAAGLGLAWRLAPAHDAFTVHLAGTLLMTAYAAVLLGAVGVGVDRLRLRAQRLQAAPRWGILGLGLAGVLGLHLINSRFLIGLYQPLHRALSELSLALLGATLVVCLSGLRARWLLGGLAGLMLTAGGAMLATSPRQARPGIWFFGTELRHLAERVEPLFDRDGDGIPPAPYGGDCDDGDPAVHPLAFEVAENGKDDNCRLGDRSRGAPRPQRRAVRPPGLAAWQAAHPKRNLILVFIDTWRWDHLDPTLTPALSRLAARSTVFTQARTTAPRTPMAWMSLLRGRFLGRCLRCRASLINPQTETVIHRLRAQGYRTYGRFVGTSWARYHGIGGFEHQRQADSIAGIHGARVLADVRRWLRSLQDGEAPFLLVGHFGDPHAPYKDHPEFPAADGSLAARYAAEVRYTDHHLGRLIADLERFSRLEDTVVAVFADHGENLGEHGDAGGHHGVSLFDEVIRVPLFLYVPGVAPRTVSDPVSLADLGPTLLELAGAAPLAGADGRSLAGYLFDAPPPPAPTISEFYDFGHRLRAIVSGRYKLIHDVHHDVRLLFDVVADPGERDDRLAAEPAVAAGLQAQLDAWVEHAADADELAPARCRDLVPQPAARFETAKEKRDKAQKKRKR